MTTRDPDTTPSDRPRGPAATATRGRRLRAGMAAAGLAALLLAGCSSGSTGASSAGDAGGGRAASEVAPAPAGAAEAQDRAAIGNAADVTVARDRKLTRTADLTIRVDRITSSVREVHDIIAGAGGYVTDEQVGGEQDLREEPAGDFGGHARITLAVPAEHLDATLGKLAKVGTVTERSTTSRDVTKEYVDTSSRITSMQTSIDRLRRLMRDATDLKGITRLESALTTREATLESLKSQLSTLKNQVAMSTVTVTLSTTAVPAEPASNPPNGFVEGLASGWHAFVSAVGAVVTLLGIVLPFLVLAALVGVPAALWWRRRRQTATVSAGTPPAPAG